MHPASGRALVLGAVAVLASCGRGETAGKPGAEDTPSSAAGVATLSIPAGTYRYVYPYNTPQLVEDHFIVIEASDAGPRVRYHGTSDEFDTTREGYPPAFFAADADSVRIAGDSLSFQLTVPPGRYVRSPVPLPGASAAAMLEPADSLIFGRVPAGPVRYSGRIVGRELVMQTPGGARRYTRMD